MANCKNSIYKLIRKISSYIDVKEDINSISAKQELWKIIEVKVEKRRLKQRLKRRLIQQFSIAASVASIIIFVALFSPIRSSFSEPDLSEIAANLDVNIDSLDEVQLIISNDAILVDEGSLISYSNTGVVGVNKKIVDSKVVAVDNENDYNKVIVPKGKRVSLLLSDGSKLDVNSGTKVIYPRTFKNNIREIFVDGEIFIDVAQNKDAPFVVRTLKFNVHALGTAFNVRAYSIEMNGIAEVVLAHGKVRVKAKTGDKIEIQANQMVSLSDGEIKGSKSVDALKYTSWRDGVLDLGVLSLQATFSRLIQFYGVKIECDAKIKDTKIYGKLDLDHSIEEVLKSLSITVPFVYEYCVETEKYNIK